MVTRGYLYARLIAPCVVLAPGCMAASYFVGGAFCGVQTLKTDCLRNLVKERSKRDIGLVPALWAHP